MSAAPHFDHASYFIKPGQKVRLNEYRTKPGTEFKNKSEAQKALQEDIAGLAEAQRVLWASAQYACLIILQGPDASGKDGLIRHVFSGVNPQGCAVHSFSAPNEEEVQHHFLWRPSRYLPGKGRISVFNRSYYEEVLIVRVHPHFLDAQHLPPSQPGEDIWQTRFNDINSFEKGLVRSATQVLKFYLHVSKGEQKKRFLARLTEPEKHWKFSDADIRERRYWKDYRQAYEDVLSHTSTEWAPWCVIPADNKWYARALVADMVAARIGALPLRYPQVSQDQKRRLLEAKRELESE
jgi:PPK2 family polyphosphate:nucleotide phosphotransferase